MKIDTRKIEILVAERKMSFGELSDAAGISRGNLKTVLTRDNNQPKTVGKMAEALGVPVEDIIAKDC